MIFNNYNTTLAIILLDHCGWPHYQLSLLSLSHIHVIHNIRVGSRDVVVMRVLASDQCGLGSIPP